MKLHIALIILLASCSSSRKASSSSSSWVDSTGRLQVDTVSLKKKDSTGISRDKSIYTTSSDSGYERTTEEEEVKYVPRTGRRADSSAPAIDAEPGTVVTVIRRTTREKGTLKNESSVVLNRTDSTVVSSADSTAGHQVAQTTVNKQQSEKSRSVARSRFLPGFMWVLALLLIAWLGWRIYRWKTQGIGIFTFINKRSTHDKESDQKT